MPNEAAKMQHQRLFQRGMRWLCGGVGLLGLSLVVNFLLFQSDQSFTWLMYGMTSAGILCLIKSMADIFGF
jgi:multisubunit Na+/H+ antiporter MnhB subunit